MSSRDRRAALDPLDILLRESLRSNTAHAAPAPSVRRRLLQRAARQRRRFPWQLPAAWPNPFRDNRPLHDHHSAQQHLLYVESLFGPRLGWFSFNQLMR
jgi:hypothetical protein